MKMFFLRVILLLLLPVLGSCARHPLVPDLKAEVQHIEMARLEVNHILLIRQLNPLFAVMGSSGLLLDAAVVAGHARKYKKRAGAVNQMCIDLFTQTLAKALRDRGYEIGLSRNRYWDYYKKRQKPILDRTDAIFRIKLKQMGFWSPGLRHPFSPSVFVLAELIEPRSREILYSDRFAVGLDVASLKLMALKYGKASALPIPDPSATYNSFAELLEKSDQSREALLKVITLAARRIATGFQRKNTDRVSVFNPRLLMDMPEIPVSTSMEGKTSHE